MMADRLKSTSEIFLLIFLLKFKIVISIDNDALMDNNTNNHSCYTCVEPLVGYTDHPDSCRFFNTNSIIGLSYIKECQNDNYTGEYECRKLIVSYRSIDTYLRRDCVPKGTCSWKDRKQSMINTPISECVYTDDSEQKLECIYCCNTPLCNRTISIVLSNHFLIYLLVYVLINYS